MALICPAPRSECERHLYATGKEAHGSADGLYVSCKRIAERGLALLLLMAACPLLMLLAAMVRLTSPGPAFYSQVRLGRYGRPFRIWKLRTMTDNCEAATGPVWSGPSDLRVTPLGRLLRHTHLDELPQLVNVLRGEMSLIGPRPERPEIAEQLQFAIPKYRRRLLVPPGVTGLAQMHVPADSDLSSVQRKLKHDLYYVENVSFLLDLRIACSTVLYFVAAATAATSKLLLRSCSTAIEPASSGSPGGAPPARSHVVAADPHVALRAA